MGYPMARHLVRSGNEVSLWSNTGAKAQELAKEGAAAVCASPKEVAERADFVFYCVGDTAMSREVALGKAGLIEGVRRGAIVADCSTISPQVSREIGAAFTAKGAHFLDAPCTGSKPGAEKATLTFMIGGDRTCLSEPALTSRSWASCSTIAAVREAACKPSLPRTWCWRICSGFAEGMVLAAKGGIAPKLMLEILDNSAAKSGLISFKAPFVLARNFETNFSTKWLHKDVGLALESGESLDVPLPVTALTQQMLRAAIAQWLGRRRFLLQYPCFGRMGLR